MAIHCLVRVLCTVRTNQFGEISYITLMATFRDQIWAQVVVAEFDNAVVLLRERMGSKYLLLKQTEAAEAFASGKVSVFGPATVKTFATVA